MVKDKQLRLWEVSLDFYGQVIGMLSKKNQELEAQLEKKSWELEKLQVEHGEVQAKYNKLGNAALTIVDRYEEAVKELKELREKVRCMEREEKQHEGE